MKLEAALLEDLNPDSFYKSFVRMPWRRGRDLFALLHWSAYYNASESTEVVCVFEFTLDRRVWTPHFCPLIPDF